MLEEYEKIYHQIENIHWWNCSRRDFIIRLIRIKKINRQYKILDIGCSTGLLIDELSELTNTEISGIDLSDNAINSCHERGLLNTRVMSGDKLEYKDSSFDIVIASDCLEHINDDQKALNEWYRVLKNGGQLIIFVPAFKFLWSEQDHLSEHFRRYNRNELRLKLEKSMFKINRISFWNSLLFIPTFLTRFYYGINQTETKMKYNQLQLPSSFINKLLISLLKLENSILTNYNMPIGVSLFAICSKN